MTEETVATGPEIPRETDHILVTGGDPEELVQCLLAVVQSATRPTQIVVATWGADADPVGQVVQTLQMPAGVTMTIVVGGFAGTDGDEPVYFQREHAVDLAVTHLATDAKVFFLLAQDARPTPGWTDALTGALETRQVLGAGGEWGQVGIAGPVTDQTRVTSQRLELQEHEVAMGPQAYATARRAQLQGKYTPAGSLDPFCLVIRREVLVDVGALLSLELLGQFAGDDLAVRARAAGWSCAVAEASYVGRTTSIPLGHRDVPGDATARLAFYRAHDERPKRLGACFRVALRTLNDLHLFRMSIKSTSKLVDCIGVVLLNNPVEVTKSAEFKMLSKTGAVTKGDVKMLKACSGASAPDVAQHVGEWIAELAMHPNTGGLTAKVRVWDLPGDEVLERNAGAAICRQLGADWVLTLEPDELLEQRITRGHLDRLMSHPNPLVRAWDFGLLYHWDSPRLIRDDEGWGHGGNYQAGPHSIRMWRVNTDRPNRITPVPGSHPAAAPYFSPEGVRVAGVRIRKFGLQRPVDREKLQHPPVEEGMRLSQYEPNNGIGLHVLQYDAEHPEDMARWLDAVHGLVDGVVLVWTGEWVVDEYAWLDKHGCADNLHTTRLRADQPVFIGSDRWWYDSGPGRDLATVAAFHGAAWQHRALDDNLATARNAGIDALDKLGGLAWAMFIDPDEWLQDTYADCVALRNMAMSSRWGWMFQVANYREGREPTISDSVRISRLDGPPRTMRMDGRVHEGFGRSLRNLDKRNIHPRWRYAPFVLQHRGMSLEAERMRTKLDRYEALLRLELADHPLNAGAWVSLGWHYFNDGHEDLGLECYERGVACADSEGGRSYLPFKELTYHHLRQARDLIDGCCERLQESHQFHKLAHELRRFLVAHAPPIPLIERPEGREPLPLPDWTAPTLPPSAGYDAP